MFFKRKKKEEKNTLIEEKSRSKEEVMSEILELKIKLKNGEDVYLRLAKCYQDIGEIDEAIQLLEECLEKNNSLGVNYNYLVRLYNIKRKEAAVNKNDEELQKYLKKIDELMQLSKDVIRGKV